MAYAFRTSTLTKQIFHNITFQETKMLQILSIIQYHPITQLSGLQDLVHKLFQITIKRKAFHSFLLQYGLVIIKRFLHFKS